MFLNIRIDLLILKTYYGQFTLTTKKNHCISSLKLRICGRPQDNREGGLCQKWTRGKEGIKNYRTYFCGGPLWMAANHS